jgi:hypothetical protein
MVNQDKFDAVLNDLKDKLTVERIMTSKEQFKYYSPENKNEFDIMPIKENNKITKFWNKETEEIKEINSEYIISSKLDLISLIDCFQEKPFYFVKHGKEIIGLVSIPDLNKSPMRVLLFLLVAEIELSLKKIFSKKIENPLVYLDETKIKDDINKYKENNLDLNAYEYLNFSHYFKILKKEEIILSQIGLSKKKLKNYSFIVDIRNEIAHPTRDITAKNNPEKFIINLKSRIERMIEFNEIIKKQIDKT